MKHLDEGDHEAGGLQPINLQLPIMKELRVKRLEDMFDYISDNPQIIILGFLSSDSTYALDGWDQEIEDTLSSFTFEFSDWDEFEDTESSSSED